MEEMKVIDSKKLKWEIRKKKFVEGATKKAKQASSWIRENQALLTVAIPAAAATTASTSKIVRTVFHRSNMKREERQRQCAWYDPSLGHYWQLKRPLRQSEQLLVNQRRKNGETLGDIFASMKVLK